MEDSLQDQFFNDQTNLISNSELNDIYQAQIILLDDFKDNQDKQIILELDEKAAYNDCNFVSNKQIDLSNQQSQDLSLVVSSEDGQPSSIHSLNFPKEKFQQITNQYQKQLQIRVKRVKQTIKKGQHIGQKKLFYTSSNNLFIYNIKLDHKLIIYGYLIIEDNFRDYESQYDSNLINQYDQYLRLVCLEKNTQSQMFSFITSPILDNVMRKFNQICQYYDNQCDQQLKNLSDQLRKFEHFIQEQDKKYQILYEKYTQEELDNYLEIYYQQALQHIKNESVDEFLYYSMFKYNKKGKQLEPIQNGSSYALLNLLGIHMDYIELILKKINSFLDPCGRNRMETILHILEFQNSNLDVMLGQKMSIRTIDNIVINATMDNCYFQTDLIPKEVNDVYKYLCTIQKLHIDVREIQKIFSQRGSNIQQLYNLIQKDHIDIESTIMAELFLEKYYPQEYQKIKETYVLLP